MIEQILSFRSCEVLVTLMYEEINRFLALPDQSHNFDLLFGTDAWRQASRLGSPKSRSQFLHDLYLRQLRSQAKARHVRAFEMRNDRDVTDYFLVYATNSKLGLKRMKEAMWKVDPSGEFKFSDATNPYQLLLFGKEPQYDILKELILKRFKGLQVSVGEIEDFVVDETPFRETHYKTKVLKPLETSTPPQLVAISPPSHRRVGTYPDPTLKIRFL